MTTARLSLASAHDIRARLVEAHGRAAALWQRRGELGDEGRPTADVDRQLAALEKLIAALYDVLRER